MKKYITPILILIINLLSFASFSQNNDEPVALGLPGDNLNLYAVLDIFQKSPTLEIFEKSINDKETKINNLDLNKDNVVDYIQVVSYKEDDSYSIVLRVAVNKKQNQDIAVIEVNKNSDGNVMVQIIGDEDLYGKNYIVEPTNLKNVSGTVNPGYVYDEKDVYYANDWPIINVMFSPGFAIYHSPWYWGYYPPYWNPWQPVYYYNYWNFHNHYFHNFFFRRIPIVRHPIHYNHYNTRRNSSNFVIRNRRNGNYEGTYEGKTYKRPDIPSNPSDRQRQPSAPPSDRQRQPSVPPSDRERQPSVPPSDRQIRPRAASKPRETAPKTPEKPQRTRSPRQK
jgi:hypothetical protein